MKAGSPESDSIVIPIIATLEHDECERARVRRDRRYDGRFFSGVRTTRIYCRPRPAELDGFLAVAQRGLAVAEAAETKRLQRGVIEFLGAGDVGDANGDMIKHGFSFSLT
jgi:hypothetical protein